MTNEVMLYELSDAQLESVTGGDTIINIVYAPVYIINSTVTNSAIDNGNSYAQNSFNMNSFNGTGPYGSSRYWGFGGCSFEDNHFRHR